MNAAISRLLSFAAKHERRLGGIAFVGGFAVDLVTFTVLSVAYANLAFAAYLFLAAGAVLISTSFPRTREHRATWEQTAAVVGPLVAQYAIGSLLSGFMIFYTKSAELSAAWPFLLLLAGVFIGNEYFRTNYKHLAFQLGLLFFALYAYLIFAIPLFVDKLGPGIFLLSTGTSVVLFALYLRLLRHINRTDLRESLRFALPGVVGTLVLISGAYFTGALPPIPLTMPESGIYHSLKKEGDRYVVLNESSREWYEFYKKRSIHAPEATSLYAYAAIAAPVKFGASVVHRWERYDNDTHRWITESRVAFPISGGRPGGYRGYSIHTPSTSGSWRVSVETEGGQVIGRIPFDFSISSDVVILTEETH